MKLLPPERLELSILEFTRMDGSARWRATTLPSLAVSVNSQDWNAVSDALVRLHNQRVLGIRKWMEPQGFVVAKDPEMITEFLNHGEFQLNITPGGRAYTEALQQRAHFEKSLSQLSGVINTSLLYGMETRSITIAEEMRKALQRPTVVEQQTIDLAKQLQASAFSPNAMAAAISKNGVRTEHSLPEPFR